MFSPIPLVPPITTAVGDALARTEALTARTAASEGILRLYGWSAILQRQFEGAPE